eukprot:5912541-Pyramimonas_sp.AAC.2
MDGRGGRSRAGHSISWGPRWTVKGDRVEPGIRYSKTSTHPSVTILLAQTRGATVEGDGAVR